MKKWGRRAVYGITAFFILLVLFDLSLRWVSSSVWVRRRVAAKLSESLQREVRLEKISASLLGIKINGLAVSEAGGFKEGPFAGVDRLRLRVSWYHLLHKHVKVHSLAVNGVYVQVIRNSDGGFNFDSLTASPADPDASSPGLPVRITANRVDLRNVNFAYLQEPEFSVRVHKASFSAHGVGIDRLFEVRLNATGEYRSGPVSALFPVGLEARVHLGEMNWQNAYVQLGALSVRANDAVLNVQGSAHDFTRPQAEFSADLRRLSSASLKPFMAELPAFFVPQIHFSAAASFDLPAQKAEISSFGFSMAGLQAGGGVTADFAQTPLYNARLMFQADLAKLASLAPELMKPYALGGGVSGTAEVSNERLSAEVSLSDAEGVFPYAGAFKGLNASLTASESGDLKTGVVNGKLTGNLNGEPFLVNFRVTQTLQKIAAVLNASAKRVTLPPMPDSEAKEPEPDFVADTRIEPVVKTKWNLPPAAVLADVRIDSLDAPFFYGTDIVFKTDLEGLTPDLKRTQGSLSLHTGNGEIRDLYRLTNASPVTKVLFLSLNVVGKVFNSLDVFSVLNGWVGADDSAGQADEASSEKVIKVVEGPDGEPVQIMVPYSSRKMDGRMKFDQFDTSIYFKSGVADMKEGTFVSDTVSFTLSGQTDFKTEKVDMSVQAAPGKHYADGIMPLKLNIGGTVANPTGSMSVLGSVSSLVTQGVANNFASNAVKKSVGGIFGLFKNKPPQAQADNKAEQELLTAPQDSADISQK